MGKASQDTRDRKRLNMPSPRTIAAALALVCASALYGFDSRAWLAERDNDVDKGRLEAAFSSLNREESLPAEDIMVPIERFDNGLVKTRLDARKAWIFPDENIVIASMIHVVRVKEDGAVELDFTADNAIVDKETKTGWVDGNAVINIDQATAYGNGAYFSFERELVRVYNQTRIVVRGLQLDPHRLLNPKEGHK